MAIAYSYPIAPSVTFMTHDGALIHVPVGGMAMEFITIADEPQARSAEGDERGSPEFTVVVEWLESQAGESWSRRYHQDRIGAFASFKNDQDWTESMNWTTAAVSESFDSEYGDLEVHAPAIPWDEVLPPCP